MPSALWGTVGIGSNEEQQSNNNTNETANTTNNQDVQNSTEKQQKQQKTNKKQKKQQKNKKRNKKSHIPPQKNKITNYLQRTNTTNQEARSTQDQQNHTARPPPEPPPATRPPPHPPPPPRPPPEPPPDTEQEEVPFIFPENLDIPPAEDVRFWEDFWENPFVDESGLPIPPSIPRFRRRSSLPVRRAAIAHVEWLRAQEEYIQATETQATTNAQENVLRPFQADLDEGAHPRQPGIDEGPQDKIPTTFDSHTDSSPTANQPEPSNDSHEAPVVADLPEPVIPEYTTVEDDPNWKPQVLKEVEAKEFPLQELYGNALLPEKPKQHVRLILGNVGNLPTHKTANKSKHFLDQLKKYNPDLFLGTETDWYLPKIKPEESWTERSRDHLPRQTTLFSYNKNDEHNTSKYQAGGTFILGLNQTQSRVVSKGQDKSGLGRWTWFRIQGRHNRFTTVFSVY